MSPQVTAAIIAGSVGLVTLIATVIVQIVGFRATKANTERQIKATHKDTADTLGHQREQLDRTLAEQRTRTLNERFATAAEQLGSDKPAVRLAGVYAMAGLADDWEENRQTCVDVLCATLRMPYEPDPGQNASKPQQLSFLAIREVRHTVIRVITAHLVEDAAVPWQGLNFDFTGVVFDGGNFFGAKFSHGRVSFHGAEFSGVVSFHGAEFSGAKVSFYGARSASGKLGFGAAKFSGGEVDFSGAKFTGANLDFTAATFSGGEVDFGPWGFTEFSGGKVSFYCARFSSGKVRFSAEFSGGEVDFTGAEFTGAKVDFGGAKFTGAKVDFGSRFSGGAVDFRGAKFTGGEVDFTGAKFTGGEVDFTGAKFTGAKVDFGRAKFADGVRFGSARFSGGTVDFSGAGDWSFPPTFPWTHTPPSGVKLPRKKDRSQE